ncbi:MAG: DUF4835 family protein [Dysgonomonas sp.]
MYSQELNATVTINSDKLQGVDKEVFNTLKTSLTQLLNERKWSETVFNQNERIECTFVFTLNTITDGNTYNGELQINSRRPVYNSSYITPTFTYKDVDVSFEYAQGDPLDYSETNITNNLVAITAYYAYIVLGIDFDTFSLNGGKPYYEQAMNIVNASQGLNKKGWAAFDGDYNRYALSLALTEESSSKFHDMWYNYHRLGLDQMANNIVRGRDAVISSLQDLNTIRSARPTSPIILFFGDTKLNEVIDIYSDVSPDEKKEAYDFLRKIYPTKSNLLETLKTLK